MLTGDAFWHGGEFIQPMSRTFFHAKVEDNPFLMATGYRALLDGGLYSPLTIKKAASGTQAQGRRVISEKTSETLLQLIDQQPRTGIRGSRVAFMHPRATVGVLTEIVQPAAGVGAH